MESGGTASGGFGQSPEKQSKHCKRLTNPACAAIVFYEKIDMERTAESPVFHISPLLAYAFVTAYTPGPNNIMAMSHASRLGLKKSFVFNIGIACGVVVVLSLCALFSAVLYAVIPTIKPYMLCIGAAYMLYLAWHTLRSGSEISEMESKWGAKFLPGMLLQLINPKVIIYGITVFSTYILPHFQAPLILFGFVMLLTLIGLSGVTCWALLGSVFHNLFSKYAKVVNVIMALLLVYCAVSLFF